jgi:hypothetical protein
MHVAQFRTNLESPLANEYVNIFIESFYFGIISNLNKSIFLLQLLAPFLRTRACPSVTKYVYQNEEISIDVILLSDL